MKIRSDVARSSASGVLIAGAGDVGMRLAQLRSRRGDEVIAVRRRESAVAAGIRHLQADLSTGAGFEQLPRCMDALVFCPAPDQRNETSYRTLYVDGLCRMLDQVQARRVIFVSSTAVFAQDTGEWIDETAPAVPETFNGRTLLAAERELSAHTGGVVLRLSGLYGPGRDALLRRARGTEPGRRHWTNRIHVDDAAVALSQLLDLSAPESLYLGSDDGPALESDVFAWIRREENLPVLAEVDAPVSGRRISNRALRASGWLPAYPDFRSGYARLCANVGV